MLAALGHDVRTPMNSIMGICSLLLDSELEQEQRIWLERIRASCEALLAMLNGLLEIASGEVGGSGLQVDEVDVIGLVQEVTDTLLPQARDKGLELKTRYDDLLRGHWLIDPTRLRQVLFNLVGNAIKFTASGHVEIRASAVTDDAGATSIKLAVSDTGPGIAPEDRTRIFERFKRGRDQRTSGPRGPRSWPCAVPGECRADGRLADGGERARCRQRVHLRVPGRTRRRRQRATSASPDGRRCWWAMKTPGHAPLPTSSAMPA